VAAFGDQGRVTGREPGMHEVHRRRSDEAGDEEVHRPVERFRRVCDTGRSGAVPICGWPGARADCALALGRDMIRRDYFAPRGIRVTDAGVGSQSSAAAIVNLWLRSPRHRENLLRPGFHRSGSACRAASSSAGQARAS